MKELEELIARARQKNFSYSEYPSIWHDVFEDPIFAPPDVADRIRNYQNSIWNALRGNTLIDLGSAYPTQDLLEVVQQSGIRKYIAVDLHVFKDKPVTDFGLKGMQVEAISDEMLSYSLGLPDNSSNCMSNAIDDDSALNSHLFHQTLAEIVLQKTAKGGVILTFSSLITTFLVNQQNLKQLDWGLRDPHKSTNLDFVFQKIA